MPTDDQTRDRLLQLVGEIRDARDYGQDGAEQVAEFETLLPDTDISNLCNSDYDEETIVDVCLGEKDIKKVLTREQLLELVKRLCSTNPEGAFSTEAEAINAVLTFKHNCRHPGSSDLIFFPEEHFGGRKDPSPEEIVEKAIQGE